MSEELQNEFKIEIRPIESVRPYDKNPRLNDKAVDAVAEPLDEAITQRGDLWILVITVFSVVTVPAKRTLTIC